MCAETPDLKDYPVFKRHWKQYWKQHKLTVFTGNQLGITI